MEKTNSKGIIAKAGRYGGTYAHKDIAFEFASWVSPLFKLYLLKEFQRLKEQEQAQIGWSAKRELPKINYRIHTDDIPSLTTEQQAACIGIVYSTDANRIGAIATKVLKDKGQIHFEMAIWREILTL